MLCLAKQKSHEASWAMATLQRLYSIEAQVATLRWLCRESGGLEWCGEWLDW